MRLHRRPAPDASPGGDCGPQYVCLVFRPALHALPLRGPYADCAVARPCGQHHLLGVRFERGGLGHRYHLARAYGVERRGFWRSGGRISEHRVFRCAAADRDFGQASCGYRHRHDFCGLGGHHVFVHRLIAPGCAGHFGGRGARTRQPRAGRAQCLARRGHQPHALGHLERRDGFRFRPGFARPGGRHLGPAGRLRFAGGFVHHRRGAGAVPNHGPRRSGPDGALVRCAAGGGDQTADPSFAGAGSGLAGAVYGRAPGGRGAHRHGAGGGVTQRQQCVYAGRALWCQ